MILRDVPIKGGGMSKGENNKQPKFKSIKENLYHKKPNKYNTV
jgi:hypothetical protein